MPKAVFCIAPSQLQLESILEQLTRAGLPNEAVSVLYPDKTGAYDFAHEQGTKAPEGATAGAGTGGLLGGALGWLAGVGLLILPGAGPFVAAGPLFATLGGAAVGGAVGGLSGALIGLGIPEFEAKRYAGKLFDGNFLISVHTEDARQRSLVKEVFKRARVRHITWTGEASASGK
jgi:hypothetical protein